MCSTVLFFDLSSRFTYPTTPLPPYLERKSAKCLVTYYGYTNETCWYETRGDHKEAGYSGITKSSPSGLILTILDLCKGTLGHHLVEAHWKYFTMDVKDAYECDRAAHLHYEFLLKRCSPRHYLPVISVFRHVARVVPILTIG